MWGGRFSGETDEAMREHSRRRSTSIRDCGPWTFASPARMRACLAAQKILSADDAQAILERPRGNLGDEIANGKWKFDPKAEDIHGEIERRLFELIGEAAKRMHTGRSRNDQVATDTRLFLKEQTVDLIARLKSLQKSLVAQAKVHTTTLMPGVTHMQHAQPVSLAHHLLAYFWMLQRDIGRLTDSLPRILSMPLGLSGALRERDF